MHPQQNKERSKRIQSDFTFTLVVEPEFSRTFSSKANAHRYVLRDRILNQVSH